jgi:aminotransferase in exopolysaccharide biosynthesis
MFNEIVKFIREIYNTKGNIPLHAPYFAGNEKKYLLECIDSTFVSSIGKFVDRFEEMLAEYTRVRKAVVCVNGTCALHIAIRLVGVEQNDEVITQALTFVATGNAINYVGAHPVFVDVDRDTMGLSPGYVEKWLLSNSLIKNDGCYNKNTGRRIKACIPMHTFGHPVHLDELVAICERYNIELVEDAAESIGSFYKNRHTGTFGRVGVISFNGNKTVTTGGGGVLLFNDMKLGEFAKHITTQAKIPHRWEFIHDYTGYNYRMPNINAALGCAQMENISAFLQNKRETAAFYKDFFSQIDEIEFFTEPVGCSSNYWLNSIILKDHKTQQSFLQYTNDQGIMTRPPWVTLNNLNMFKNCQSDGLENTNWLQERVVNLPSSFRK